MSEFWSDGARTIHHGDCLDVLPTLEADSVSLCIADPPYYRVKAFNWDRQWASVAEYLAWLDQVLAELFRVLAPNGSLYLFASSQMAARVECLVAERFEVLNRITWAKPPFATKAEMFRKNDLRAYFPASEAIIFAEQGGSDGYARGEAGWVHKCDELRGFVFEPLRAYLDEERMRAGLSDAEMRAELGVSLKGGGLLSHYWGRSQWMLPTREHYEKLRVLFNTSGNGSSPFLERDHEDLRREYEDLRRPFMVSADVPYTDVWEFGTVSSYPGKHPCEKPADMMRHIVAASSRPGDLVLDPFAGSGVVGQVASDIGRRYIGIEAAEEWCHAGRQRLAQLTLDEM